MSAEEIINLYKDKYGYVSDIKTVSEFLKSIESLSVEERSNILLEILKWNLKIDKENKNKLKGKSKRKKEKKDGQEKIDKKKSEEITKTSIIDVSSYINSLKECDDEDFLTELLPSIYDNNYESIIMAILLDFYQEISLAYQMIEEENDKDSIEYLRELINRNKKIIKIIKEYNQEEETPEEAPQETEENTLIFLPRSSDSLFIDSDIDDISIEDDILPILRDIKQNRITREKRFHSQEELKGISAIRKRDSRIIFARIDSHVVVILGVLVKRFQNPTTYRDMLEARGKRYKAIREELKELIKSPEFIAKNNETYESIINRLNTRNKALIRGDSDETNN